MYVPDTVIERAESPWKKLREEKKRRKLEGERTEVREEDKNPDDCRCGRAWYPRFDTATSRKFTKICPGCGQNTSECGCGI